MKKQFKQIVAGLALGVCSLAHGTELNFNNPGLIRIDGNKAVYNEAGYAITGDAASFLPIEGIGTGMSGALLLLANNPVKLGSTAGTPFSFSSLDAGLLGAGPGGTLSITGFFLDNTQKNITLSLLELSSYSIADWSSLTSVSFSANADVVLDTLIVATSPVPEPGSVGMLLFGLATLVAARRLGKKKH